MQTPTKDKPRPVDQAPRLRSPLIIGLLAYGLLLWMVLIVTILIAWRLSGG